MDFVHSTSQDLLSLTGSLTGRVVSNLTPVTPMLCKMKRGDSKKWFRVAVASQRGQNHDYKTEITFCIIQYAQLIKNSSWYNVLFAALTTEASLVHCEQCGFNARCVTKQTNTIGATNIEEEPTRLENGTEIPVDPDHECVCSHFNCPSRPHINNKVCGSNGDTYPTLCHMRLDSCKKQQPIFVLHRGDCKGMHLAVMG